MDGKWKIELAESALKRRFTRMDAIAAIARARLEANPFEQSRVPGAPDPAGWIGPAVDDTELEVFAEVDEGERVIWVFHMMEARPGNVRKIESARKGMKS
jgi:hypothetical protein